LLLIALIFCILVIFWLITALVMSLTLHNILYPILQS
jgi:hypothetical protein